MHSQSKNKKGEAGWQTVPQRRRNTQKGPSPSPVAPKNGGHSSDSSSLEVTTSGGSSSPATVHSARGMEAQSFTAEQSLSAEQLQNIVKVIHANKWKFIFRDLMSPHKRLPLIEVMISDIDKNYQGDVEEQKYQALCKWQSVVGAEATLEKLEMVLKKHGCWDEDDTNSSFPVATTASEPTQGHPAGTRPKERVEKPKITWDGKQLSIQRGANTQHIPLQGKLNGGGQQISDPGKIADAMLVSIINPNQAQHKYEMEFNELKKRFCGKYGKNMLQDLGIGGIKSFIRHRSKLLILIEKDQKYVVQEKKNESETVSGKDLSDSKSEVQRKLGVSETATEIPSIHASSTYVCQEEEPPWQLPKKSPRNKKQKPPFTEAETPCRKYCPRVGAAELKTMVSKCEESLLIFRTEEEYTGEKGSQVFTKDVVALWNTPKKGNDHAYIILGVKPASSPPYNLLGLKQPNRVNEDYQEKFMKVSFSSMPQFLYSEVELSNKIFGVVCIPNGAGFGKVCRAVETCFDGEWCQGDIFFRDGKILKCAAEKDQDAIYGWFRKRSSVASNEEDGAWMEFLQQLDVENHQRRSYCLLVSRCLNTTPNLSTLAHFPWVKVWDFDPDSRESGLLAVCEAELQDRLSVKTWQDPPQTSLSDSFTEWMFVRGLRKREGSLVLGKVKEWGKVVGTSLNAHCDQMSRSSEKKPLTVVVLWYGSTDCLRHLYKALGKIDECPGGITYIICMQQAPEDEDSQGVIRELCTQLEIPKVIEIPLDRLCFELFSLSCCRKRSGLSCQLPGSDNIKSRESHWIQEELDVLYTGEFSTADTSNLGEEFLKGGNLTWQELDLNVYDAKRTVSSKLSAYLHDHLYKGFSGIVTLFHEPGAGGTTLSRRTLWDLHEKFPCAYAISDIIDPTEIYQRLEVLYQHTHLPILLVVDGQESRLVKELFEMSQDAGIHIIILSVQRYTMEIRNKTQWGDRFWLRGEVDNKEAVRFKHVFSQRCTGDTKRRLSEMVQEVEEKQATHYVYEFGLAVYNTEYIGLRSYVEGYLGLQRNEELSNWQRAVGYLALAFYYGHKSIPCQFFSMLFDKKESEVVKADDVLTHSGKQFVLEDTRNCTWRITHHAVAKEILEQILYGRQNESKGIRLSVKARRNLKKFAKEFLTYASEKQQRSKFDPSSSVMRILRGIFIHRDYRETGQDEQNKRERLSRLICDIPCSNTSSDQLEVMEHLVTCFPEDPTCLAHLGRAYIIFTQNYELAHKYLTMAKDLRMKEMKTNKDKGRVSGDSTSEGSSESDSILCTIYHNLGTLCHEQIKELIGGGKLGGDKKYKRGLDETDDILFEVHKYACRAVDCFTNCRRHLNKGMDASYGYIGEIKLRLHVADFVERCYKLGGYYGFLTKEHQNVKLQEFLESCFHSVDNLLREYQDLMTPTRQAEAEELDSCQNWFSAIFHDAEMALKYWQGKEDVESNRGKIAVYKLKQYQKDRSDKAPNRRTPAQVLNNFTADDLKKVIQLYEGIFQNAYMRSIRIDISTDLRDWMVAIRHRHQPAIYSIEEKVLPQVENCCRISPSSATALYYHYVLNTTLALLTQRMKYVAESNRLLEKLKRMRSKVNRLHRKYAWEWLGTDKRDGSIRILVHRSCLGVWDSENRFWQDDTAHTKLQVCTGVITNCKMPLHGHIGITTGGLTVGHHSGSLEAVYVPKQCGLFGKNYCNTEVEFYIGFNIENGIEAYNVLELKKYPCSHCNITLSVSRLSKPFKKICERCGHALYISEDSDS